MTDISGRFFSGILLLHNDNDSSCKQFSSRLFQSQKWWKKVDNMWIIRQLMYLGAKVTDNRLWQLLEKKQKSYYDQNTLFFSEIFANIWQ